MSTRPITIADRPDATVASGRGLVSWSQWCADERRRLIAHGLHAIVARTRSGTRIYVAVARSPRKGSRA